jgi:hypothetical protein
MMPGHPGGGASENVHAPRGWCPEHFGTPVPDRGGFGRSGREQPRPHRRGDSVWYVPVQTDGLRKDERVQARERLRDDETLLEAVGRRPGVYVHLEDQRGAIGGLTVLGQICAFDLLEVRRSASYRSNPAISGMFAFSSELGGYHLPFESLEERRHLSEAVWRGARFLATQPVLLAWQFGRFRVNHVPDILVERTDGSRLLIDVHATRSDPGRESDFLLKARLTAVAAASLGWDYQAVEPIPRQRARNLDHFGAFAKTSERVRAAAQHIFERVSWPRSIGGVLEDVDANNIERNVALAGVFHLVWQRHLWLNPDLPVRTHTVLRDHPLPADEAQPWIRDLRR